METIASLLKKANELLEEATIPEARREARSLLSSVIARDLAFLVAHPEFEVGETEAARFFASIRRRALHEPFHYITGVKDFYGLEFEVSPAVLIPRPETEQLVEHALGTIADLTAPRFCEVGIGSGCIAVSLLHHESAAEAVGLEISPKAIEVAARNAERHKVSSRLELRRSDIFSSLENSEKFNMIVSNPPYVSESDVEGLQAEVRLFEPRTALTDGADGLSVIRTIVDQAPRHLVNHGSLFLEIGFGQGDAVLAMFDMNIWQSAELYEDLQCIPRVVKAVLADT